MIYQADYFLYEILNNGTVRITRYNGSDQIITVPSKIDGHTVTEIGHRAFEGCSVLTSIVIPDSVTEIGMNAFQDCTGLTSIVIPGSVTEIGRYAFQGCSAELTVFVTSGSYAEEYCKMNSIRFELSSER